jgi:hypothetical protein
LVNAPHVRARYRLGRRVHGPGPCVRVCGRSDADPVSYAAHRVALSDCVAVAGVSSTSVHIAVDKPGAIAFGEPVGVRERFAVGQSLGITKRVTRAERVSNTHAVGVPVARAVADSGGARSRPSA